MGDLWSYRTKEECLCTGCYFTKIRHRDHSCDVLDRILCIKGAHHHRKRFDRLWIESHIAPIEVFTEKEKVECNTYIHHHNSNKWRKWEYKPWDEKSKEGSSTKVDVHLRENWCVVVGINTIHNICIARHIIYLFRESIETWCDDEERNIAYIIDEEVKNTIEYMCPCWKCINDGRSNNRYILWRKCCCENKF